MNPSDLPWWGWLLGGLAGIIAGLLIHGEYQDSPAAILGLILAASGCLIAVIGVVRLIKWAWSG